MVLNTGYSTMLKFVELDAAQFARSLGDVDAAAVREEDKDKPWVKTLIEAYRSEPVKQFILARFKGAYVPSW